jgi:hypothetical protein
LTRGDYGLDRRTVVVAAVPTRRMIADELDDR